MGAAAVMWLIPLGAPNVWPFAYIIRCMYSIFGVGNSQHPLVNDYVKKDSRGKAQALH